MTEPIEITQAQLDAYAAAKVTQFQNDDAGCTDRSCSACKSGKIIDKCETLRRGIRSVTMLVVLETVAPESDILAVIESAIRRAYCNGFAAAIDLANAAVLNASLGGPLDVSNGR